jgi:hypothetical protein
LRAFWQGGSPAIYPGDLHVEFLAKVDGCVVEALVRGCGPQVELVSCRSALETVIGVLAEICRKRSTPLGSRAMDRTRASHLVATGVSRNKTEELQHLGDRNLRAHTLKVNARHACTLGNREEEPVLGNVRTKNELTPDGVNLIVNIVYGNSTSTSTHRFGGRGIKTGT